MQYIINIECQWTYWYRVSKLPVFGGLRRRRACDTSAIFHSGSQIPTFIYYARYCRVMIHRERQVLSMESDNNLRGETWRHCRDAFEEKKISRNVTVILNLIDTYHFPRLRFANIGRKSVEEEWKASVCFGLKGKRWGNMERENIHNSRWTRWAIEHEPSNKFGKSIELSKGWDLREGGFSHRLMRATGE